MNLHAALDPALWMPRKDDTPFTYWLSLSPMAPAFGVPWRFAEVVGDSALGEEPMPRAAARVAQAVIDETVESTADAMEIAAELASEAQSAVAPKGLLKKRPAAPDDLKMLKGVGPKLEHALNGMGIYTFAQVAEFSEENLLWIDDNLNAFKGRALRDGWIEQARQMLGR
ncbi:MAG: NADH:ubiquinone oxidoreductase [Pseudomonadota bacterium]